MKNNSLFSVKNAFLLVLFLALTIFTINSCKKEEYYELPKEFFRIFPYELGDSIQVFNDSDTVLFIITKSQFRNIRTDLSNINTYYVNTQELRINCEESNPYHFSIDARNNPPNWEVDLSLIFTLPYNDTILHTGFNQDPMEIKFSNSIFINEVLMDSILIIPNMETNDSLFIKYGVGNVKIRGGGKNYFVNNKTI